MPDAAASTTLCLLVYPAIWDAVLAEHPPIAASYCWKSHFRALCRRAREVWRDAPIELQVAGEAERAFIFSLADIDPEVFILWMAAQGRPARRQLDFCDPHDLHLRPEPAPPKPVGRRRPDAYI
jgi:hypothetical protein